jgi:hypothetical protein
MRSDGFSKFEIVETITVSHKLCVDFLISVSPKKLLRHGALCCPAFNGFGLFRVGNMVLAVSVKGEFLAFLFQCAFFLANTNIHARVIPFFVTYDIMGHGPLLDR